MATKNVRFYPFVIKAIHDLICYGMETTEFCKISFKHGLPLEEVCKSRSGQMLYSIHTHKLPGYRPSLPVRETF